MSIERWTEPASPTGLASWAAEAGAAAEIAGGLAATPFVPQSLRVLDQGQLDVPATTAMVAAALLTGRELGLSPMASLRTVDIVQGTPALRSLAQRALVLARGHDLWLVESTATRCIMRGKRAGSEHTQEVTWTLDRARALGIANREQWRRQPAAMLVARCSAELARLIAPEAVLGLPYVVEELGDGDAPEAELSAEAPRATRKAKRAVRPIIEAQLPPLPAPEREALADDEPPLDDELPEPPPDTQAPPEPPEPRLLTSAQVRALGAAFSAVGVTNRDDALSLVAGVIGRQVASRNELTVQEASDVLDMLADLQQGMAGEPEDDPA